MTESFDRPVRLTADEWARALAHRIASGQITHAIAYTEAMGLLDVDPNGTATALGAAASYAALILTTWAADDGVPVLDKIHRLMGVEYPDG